jgi:hypothetical protein
VPGELSSDHESEGFNLNTIFRDILAVMAGVFLGAIIVLGVQTLGHALFPTLEGMDTDQIQNIAAPMSGIPIGAMLFVLLAWFLGALSGVWLAIASAPFHKKLAGGLVGFIQWLMALQTLNMLPHPLWMTVTGLLTAPLATFIVFMWVGNVQDEPDMDEEDI